MKKTTALLALLALAVVGLGGCASTGEPDPDQRYATLVTGFVAGAGGRAYPVEVSQIDGRSLYLGDYDPNLERFENSRATHRIPPGTHTIRGIPIIRSRDYVGGSMRMSGLDRPILPLVHNFQSGVRYYLAVERSQTSRRQWQVVIWKEEETEQGLLDLE